LSFSLDYAALGVPQRSVLGPQLFSLFIAPIFHVACADSFCLQQYATHSGQAAAMLIVSVSVMAVVQFLFEGLVNDILLH
jgi:hypothetical protein